MGFTNLPARLPADASSLYAKNLLALLPLLTDKDSKAFAPALGRRDHQRRDADAEAARSSIRTSPRRSAA